MCQVISYNLDHSDKAWDSNPSKVLVHHSSKQNIYIYIYQQQMGEIEKDSQTRFDHSLQHGEANLKEIVLNEYTEEIASWS